MPDSTSYLRVAKEERNGKLQISAHLPSSYNCMSDSIFYTSLVSLKKL